MKILKKECKYCGRVIESPYENQLIQNLKVHEMNCKENPENKKGDENGV